MIIILVFFLCCCRRYLLSIMNLLFGLIVFTLVPSWTCPVLLLRFYDLECQIIIVLLCGNPFVAGVELITQAVGVGFCRGTNGHVRGKCLTWMLMWPYGWWILLKFCHGIWVCVRAGVEFWRLKLFCCGFCWGLCCRTLGNHVIAEFWWPFIIPLCQFCSLSKASQQDLLSPFSRAPSRLFVRNQKRMTVEQ